MPSGGNFCYLLSITFIYTIHISKAHLFSKKWHQIQKNVQFHILFYVLYIKANGKYQKKDNDDVATKRKMNRKKANNKFISNLFDYGFSFYNLGFPTNLGFLQNDHSEIINNHKLIVLFLYFSN